MTVLTIIADGLDDAAIAAVLRDRQRRVAQAGDTAAHPTETLLAFDLGGIAHALPIGDVRAVAALPPVSRVPQTPGALLGLVAWRGAVVNLFAPAAALGREATAAGAMIVLRHDKPRIALAVDRLLGVVTAGVDPAPPTLTRLVDTGGGDRLTRIDPAQLIDHLLPKRLQEG
ncbi:hypothetical protein ASG37_11315 [Sphingomonas sp. Leaf407]|uniref:chemotaxis protein CheW n=1 Tax=unclassified Sphingomonas TaxID=196159 RepID=UPI0006F81BA8|nr:MULTISPECIES: chemotaxis protein CheW [unclassified Sphingomonas]KQN37612.1 hypothetical protein ASE97_08605 [Sphingomonas sp. Leaf42]KQT27979.1 hypothetical protein ASG37_11315 [Sphingomonas sp. Leaf407]